MPAEEGASQQGRVSSLLRQQAWPGLAWELGGSRALPPDLLSWVGLQVPLLARTGQWQVPEIHTHLRQVAALRLTAGPHPARHLFQRAAQPSENKALLGCLRAAGVEEEGCLPGSNWAQRGLVFACSRMEALGEEGLGCAVSDGG